MNYVSPWVGHCIGALGVAALAWTPAAIGQTHPEPPATAIVSSGGSASVATPDSSGSTLRPSTPSADPWTAARPPQAASSTAGHPQAALGGGSSPLRQVTRVDDGTGPSAAASTARAGSPSATVSHPAGHATARTPLAPPSKSGGEDRPAAPGSLGAMVSVGSSLLMVVGLFLGVAWCYRKTLASTAAGGLPKQVV